MRILCKIFGHKWQYYLTTLITYENYRVCKRCLQLEEYKTIPVFKTNWYAMVQRTKKGAEEWLKKL